MKLSVPQWGKSIIHFSGNQILRIFCPYWPIFGQNLPNDKNLKFFISGKLYHFFAQMCTRAPATLTDPYHPPTPPTTKSKANRDGSDFDPFLNFTLQSSFLISWTWINLMIKLWSFEFSRAILHFQNWTTIDLQTLEFSRFNSKVEHSKLKLLKCHILIKRAKIQTLEQFEGQL